jgi:hypothetical protein
VAGRSAGRLRLFLQDTRGGDPRPLPGEIAPVKFERPISPDGRWILTRAPDGSRLLQPIAGGPARAAKGIGPRDRIAGWSADGRSVFVRRECCSFAAVVDRVDLTSGTSRPLRTIGPSDQTGRGAVPFVHVTPDGKSYAYSVGRELSTLYLVEGLPPRPPARTAR